MRALSFVLASCLFLGCATTSRVRDVEQRLDVVEGFLGIQLKRYDDSTWGKKLGGPEASEAVASVGTWVPAQAEKMLLGAGMAGGGGLTYPGSLTLTTLTVSGVATAASFVATGAGFGLGQSGLVQGLAASGSDLTINTPVGFTLRARDSGGNPFFNATATGVNYPAVAGTAGSGTGITANSTAEARTYVHKITVARTALTAAATTQDVTIWTVPAKTRVLRVVEDVTAAFDDAAGPISAVVTRCGPAVNSAAYLLDGSAFSVTTLGDVAAEIGAGLLSATVADIPSFSATTAISCRWTATGGNLSTLTTGSSTFYIEAVTYP